MPNSHWFSECRAVTEKHSWFSIPIGLNCHIIITLVSRDVLRDSLVPLRPCGDGWKTCLAILRDVTATSNWATCLLSGLELDFQKSYPGNHIKFGLQSKILTWSHFRSLEDWVRVSPSTSIFTHQSLITASILVLYDYQLRDTALQCSEAQYYHQSWIITTDGG